MGDKKPSTGGAMALFLVLGLITGNLLYEGYKDWQENEKERLDRTKIAEAINALDITLCENQGMNYHYNRIGCVQALVERTEPPECDKLSDRNLVYACNTFNALKHGDDSICENMAKCSIDRDSCYAQFCTRGNKSSCEKICSPALKSQIQGSPGAPIINLAS